MLQLICDGTGKPIDKATEVGIVIKRQYGPEAEPIARAFLKERDELHDEVAKHWQEALQGLIARYDEKLLFLPDVEKDAQ